MNVRTYALVTGAYWAFTVTDGALRMLVLLHFHELGYSPLALGLLFVLYEALGVVTNFVGGRLGGRFGLNRTLLLGLATQVVALTLLSFQDPDWVEWASVAFVMGTQALAGVAKDLTKLSSKATLRLVVPDANGQLFRWVAVLTGSKNALKGVGFFVGGALLATVGFAAGLRLMAAALVGVLALVLVGFRQNLGRAEAKASQRSWLSDSTGINRLSAARVFLFASRDLWFVVALPIFLTEELEWRFEQTGAFMAAWVIGYGMVQSAAPRLVRTTTPERAGLWWVAGLTTVTGALALGVAGLDDAGAFVTVGLFVFGAVFAVNSSIHSYLVLAYTNDSEVAADVGFYYSANAVGRLFGTLASGAAYLAGGLAAALAAATVSLVAATVITRALPSTNSSGRAVPIDDGLAGHAIEGPARNPR